MRVKGFTLVEVLIASVILFAAVGLATQAYINSNKTLQVAEDTLELLSPIPLLLGNIELALRNVPIQNYSFEGEALGVKYRWRAEPSKTYAPAPRFDPDNGLFVEYPERFAMYQIELVVVGNGKERVFTYQKLGWSEASTGNFEGRAIED